MQAGFHLVAGSLITAGAVADPGLYPSDHFATRNLIAGMVIVQAILLASFLLGRWSRQATLATVTELDRAIRSIAQREVLLQEARHDIDRALQVGRAGYMSGQVLGSYRLGAVLGRGAMGEVYEAAHVESGGSAAVKLLSPDLREDPVYLARFLREAQIAASLESPHVVRVLEVGNESAEVPYLAMERLRGQDLGHLLRDRPRLGLREEWRSGRMTASSRGQRSPRPWPLRSPASCPPSSATTPATWRKSILGSSVSASREPPRPGPGTFAMLGASLGVGRGASLLYGWPLC